METQSMWRVAISSSFGEWWRYNVYIILAGFDSEGRRVDYGSVIDEIYHASAEERTAPPADYPADRISAACGKKCAKTTVLVYVLTNTFPHSIRVADSPDFQASIEIELDGVAVRQFDFKVNQFGGATFDFEL